MASLAVNTAAAPPEVPTAASAGSGPRQASAASAVPSATEAAAALLHAAQQGDVPACEEALRYWPEILEACDSFGRTALILAAREGHYDVCDLLLAIHADVEATDLDNRTPLSYAARGKHTETIRLLLDHGADVEATDCIVRDMGCITI